MEIFHDPPSASQFTPLAEHQSRTPSSFYSGPPVLHHYSPDCKLVILEYEDLDSSPFAKLIDPSSTATSTNGHTTNGDQPLHHSGESGGGEVAVEGVDVWVTSEKFLLYRSSLHAGISIPYPSISLHAIQSHASPSTTTSSPSQGLYMQLDTSDGFDDHDEANTIGLTLIPAVAPQASTSNSSHPIQTPSTEPLTDDPPEPPIQTLFAALSACANLHPDPVPDGSEDDSMNEGAGLSPFIQTSTDGLPPPMPGSGGWITAENMGEYFDEEGNWRVGAGGGDLGAGAGIVRARENEEDSIEEGNGEGEEAETKWRRVD